MKGPVALALAPPKPMLNHSVDVFFTDASPAMAREMMHVRQTLLGLIESLADERAAHLKQGQYLCALEDYGIKQPGKKGSVFGRVLNVLAKRFEISQATAYRRMELYRRQMSLKPSETVLQAVVATNTPLLTGRESVDRRVMGIMGPPPRTSDPERALQYVKGVRDARREVVQRLKGSNEELDVDTLMLEEVLSLQRMHNKLLDADPRTRARVGRTLAEYMLGIFSIPAQHVEPRALREDERLKPVGRPPAKSNGAA